VLNRRLFRANLFLGDPIGMQVIEYIRCRRISYLETSIQNLFILL